MPRLVLYELELYGRVWWPAVMPIRATPPLHGRVSGPKDEARVQGTSRCTARPWGRLHRNVEFKAGPGGGGSAHLAPSHFVDSVFSGLRYGCGSDAAAPTAGRAAANGINFAACCS